MKRSDEYNPYYPASENPPKGESMSGQPERCPKCGSSQKDMRLCSVCFGGVSSVQTAHNVVECDHLWHSEPAAQPKPDAGMEERAREWLKKSFDWRWKLASDHSIDREAKEVKQLAAFAQQERNRVARECEEIAMDADTNHDASQQIRTLYPKAFEEEK